MGVRMARVPVWVLRRTWLRPPVGGDSSSLSITIASPLLFIALIAEERVEGSSVMLIGKWPMWKVDLCRRRWPEREFGSRYC
jgi:hypothetical protein